MTTIKCFTDGSYNHFINKASYAIYFPGNRRLNTYGLLDSEMKSADLAEAKAIEVALTTAPITDNLEIYTDSHNVADKIQEYYMFKSLLLRSNPIYKKIVQNIVERVSLGGIINIYKIFGHLPIYAKHSNPKSSKKLEILKTRWPDQWEDIIRCNRKADHLAKKGLKSL